VSSGAASHRNRLKTIELVTQFLPLLPGKELLGCPWAFQGDVPKPDPSTQVPHGVALLERFTLTMPSQ